jgi:hypothetical protein
MPRDTEIAEKSVVLEAIEAFLLANLTPDSEARAAKLDALVTTFSPELAAHLQYYGKISPEMAAQELKKVQMRKVVRQNGSDQFSLQNAQITVSVV